MTGKILVFAGTFEGRQLCQFLYQQGFDFFVCVATEYGEYCLNHLAELNIMSKRLNCEDMTSLMKNGFKVVVDATHPYALEVSNNIYQASKNANIRYIRLQRESIGSSGQARIVANIDEAIAYLNTTAGNILITTGINHLDTYHKLDNFRERLFVRVLPSIESIQKCLNCCIQQSHIIAMQGPFSQALNQATIEQYNCKFLVSKNSGVPGGVEEKIAAGQSTGCEVILIEKPKEQPGHSLAEVIEMIKCV